eukprot:m.1224730 g.1224730  ORF g.1224730 m.1224730 type:complete len:1106 (-) comp24627_c0_seq5:2169-5486(-)
MLWGAKRRNRHAPSSSIVSIVRSQVLSCSNKFLVSSSNGHSHRHVLISSASGYTTSFKMDTGKRPATSNGTNGTRSRRRVEIGYEGSDAAHLSKASSNSTSLQHTESNGVLPSANLSGLQTIDNAAIALRTITAGEFLYVGTTKIGVCQFDIPEGHRFATQPIAKDQQLLSWGIPFGIAERDIAQGEYLCNSKVLATFAGRKTSLNLPSKPNFRNVPFSSFQIDATTFKRTMEQVTDAEGLGNSGQCYSFMGYPRSGNRGTGTRNYIVIIGITSDVAGFTRSLAERFKKEQRKGKLCGVDGVVAVAHTEGGQKRRDVRTPKENPDGDAAVNADTEATNRDKVLRTLAGFVVHPNVGGICFVDDGFGQHTKEDVWNFMTKEGFPVEHVPVRSHVVVPTDAYEDGLRAAEAVVTELIAEAAGAVREPRPLSEIVLAQQCGGSDAFSGISANPLTGWVSRQIVAHHGGVVLAETDELIGAEAYVLDKLRDLSTGQQFLGMIDRFYAYAQQFGHSPEGNPSGGNLYRGLYNITLKSAGAAMKKFPDVRLDHVLEYGERLGHDRRGYCFMDSPGNDLESIAGQVATGCNMVVFTTGNGAITNFPFVPTVKVLTTTARYNLLQHDMDVNAGAYLDGTKTMDQLGHETLQYILKAASGAKTKGELAGHHQVHLWREWRRVDDGGAPPAGDRTESAAELAGGLVTAAMAAAGPGHHDGVRTGVPLTITPLNGNAGAENIPQLPSSIKLLPAVASPDMFVTEHVGLVLPTSLCSSQVSNMLASRLHVGKDTSVDERKPEGGDTAPRVLALPHTEGCGNSAGPSEAMFVRTLLGYAVHPMIARAVLVEHGCEKTHNDRISEELRAIGKDPSVFGYASIQLDGGIEGAFAKVRDHMAADGWAAMRARVAVGPEHLRVGVCAVDAVPRAALQAVGAVAQRSVLALTRTPLRLCIVAAGGTVVASGSVVGADFLHALYAGAADAQNGTLGYGQRAETPGLHTMHASTNNIAEVLTGLGATGVEIIVVLVDKRCVEPHPLVPVVQVATHGALADADVFFTRDAAAGCDAVDSDAKTQQRWQRSLVHAIVDTAERTSLPKLFGTGFTNMQISRGDYGISL